MIYYKVTFDTTNSTYTPMLISIGFATTRPIIYNACSDLDIYFLITLYSRRSKFQRRVNLNISRITEFTLQNLVKKIFFCLEIHQCIYVGTNLFIY
jgi:hypothetical protein